MAEHVGHKLEMVPLEDLKPAELNPKDHDVGALIRSMGRFGFVAPVIVDEATGRLVVGHGRLKALVAMLTDGQEPPRGIEVGEDGRWLVPVVRGVEFASREEALAYLVADNRLTELGGWDEPSLAEALALLEETVGLDGVGYDPEDVDAMLVEMGRELQEKAEVLDLAGRDARVDADALEEYQARWHVEPGDLWLVPSATCEGEHRIVCGDSTDPEVVARAAGGDEVVLVATDPPYGLGKQSEGVLNDNRDFGGWMELMNGWWEAALGVLSEIGSVYVWGMPDRLWTWWVRSVASAPLPVTFRNEIVWVKPTAQSMGGGTIRQYPPRSERCLFFVMGQVHKNVNEEWFQRMKAPILEYLVGELERMGWSRADVNRIVGTAGMAGHYFSRSQFEVPTRERYEMLQEAAGGKAFTMSYDELGELIEDPGDEISRPWRAYFDNGHEVMSDVWEFSLVPGAERWGHATPKPVPLMERILVSSAPPGALVLDPFLGTGTTIVAGENRGRRVCGIELAPEYVAVTLERLSRLGLEPRRDGSRR